MDDLVVDPLDDAPLGGAAPPPPPPPPPPPASGVFRMAPVSVTGMPELLSRLEKFAGLIVGLEREVSDIHAAAKLVDLAAGVAPVPVPSKPTDAAELDLLKLNAKKLKDENERLEGEVQSLRLFREQTRDKIQKAVSSVVDLKLDPKTEEAVRALVVDRDRLQEEKAKLEGDISRFKNEASKRFSSMKNDLESAKKEGETVRMQKDNLMRQLQARDAESSGLPKEVTLEDITNSEVFRTMLSNIRKTSRQEITILHDAIASVRAIDPKAYETCLEIVSRAFKKAQVENPLALLPRD
jgi:hypothetical protein